MDRTEIIFIKDMEIEARNSILNFHRTGDDSDFIKISDRSAHSKVYRHKEHPYVLKIYKPEGRHTQDLEQFILERLYGSWFSPCLYAYVKTKFIVMDYIEGLTIENYLSKKGALPDTFYDRLKDALQQFTKKSDYILRDMKVEDSVLINLHTGDIKLIDYGVGDSVVNFPEEAIEDMLKKGFIDFLDQLRFKKILSSYPEAKKVLNKVLEMEQSSFFRVEL